MKVRIVKNHKEYKEGDVVEVTPNIAHGLIDRGIARTDKMMTSYNTAALSKRRRNRDDDSA